MSSSNHKKSTSRRKTLQNLIGAVVAIGAIFGSYQYWQHQSSNPMSAPTASEGNGPDIVTLPHNWWDMTWQTPDGTRLSLRQFKGRPIVINFWASWCSACVTELPKLNSFVGQPQANNVQFIGFAVQSPKQLRQFINASKIKWTYPVVAIGMDEGLHLINNLSHAAPGLPFTIFLDSHGQIQQRIEGILTDADLKSASALK